MTYVEALTKFIEFQDGYDTFAIHCDGPEKAEDLVKSLYAIGYSWGPGRETEDEQGNVITNWKEKKKETCYTIGVLRTSSEQELQETGIIFYGRKKYYEKQERKIIEVDEIFAEVDNEAQENENPEIKENIPAANNGNKNNETDVTNLENTKNDLDNIDNTVKECPHCSKILKGRAKFCTDCGYKFEIPKEETSEPKAVSNKLTNEKTDENSSVKDEPKKISVLDKLGENMENLEVKVLPVVKSSPVEDKIKASVIPIVEVSTGNKPDDNKNNKIDTNNSNKPNKTTVNTVVENANNENFDNKSILHKILGVEINQPFRIISNQYQDGNSVYRINKDGFREKKMGENTWFVCTNEQELVFIINHAENIFKV